MPFSPNSAEHRQDIRGVCCLKPHRWQVGEIITSELNFTELPHGSPIVITSENTSAGARPSIGRCPVHLRQPEDEVFLMDTGPSSSQAPIELRLMWDRALKSTVPVADRYKGHRPMLGRNPAGYLC